MNDIEKRALIFAEKCGGDNILGSKGVMLEGIKKQYIKVAEEQWERDKRLFKNWIKREFFDNFEENRGTLPGHPSEIDSSRCWTVEELISQFDKDMESEDCPESPEMTLWAAADGDGGIFLFLDKPVRNTENRFWDSKESVKNPKYLPTCVQLPKEWFPELTWENEPMKVRLWK